MIDQLCGAIIDPAATAEVQEHFVAQGVSLSRMDLIGWREGETVCLWDAELELFGQIVNKPPQRTGTCVGVNGGQAVCDSILNAVAFADQLMDSPPHEVAWEVAWAHARTANDIGRGSLRGDGCVGSWFARAAHDYGLPARGRLGKSDLTVQDENFAQKYGRSGNRVPVDVLEASEDMKIAAAFWPQSIEEILGVLRARYGMFRCGNKALGAKRNKWGYAGLVSSGGHCQSWRGVVELKNGPFIVEQQLWLSNQPQGEQLIEDKYGRPVTLPHGAALIDPDEAKQFIRNGEVIAFAAPKSLPRRAA